MPNEINVLQVLDEMDKFRRNHQDPKKDPSDWCMRCMEAILAHAAGYESRNDWTDALRADKNTKYSQDLEDITKLRTF